MSKGTFWYYKSVISKSIDQDWTLHSFILWLEWLVNEGTYEI